MAGTFESRYGGDMSQYIDEQPPPPYVPPPSEAPPKEILKLPLFAALRWLQLGWQDFRAQAAISLFYGVAFWGMAMVMGLVFRNSPEYTMTLVSGCLLIGPFLALGLYEVSRRRELGQAPSFISSLTCWKSHLRSLGLLVGVLIVLELLWGRASLVVIAVFFNSGMPSSVGVMQSLTNPDNFDFVIAYMAVGGIFASLVFAISVVSIPMILDRDTDAITAAITSIAVVLENTPAMVLWGVLIATLVGLSLLLPWSVGVLVAGPLLGHASWHAYRSSVRWLTP
jgi:uncharacterized membrane protein